jgi:hypothetical protein
MPAPRLAVKGIDQFPYPSLCRAEIAFYLSQLCLKLTNLSHVEQLSNLIKRHLLCGHKGLHDRRG